MITKPGLVPGSEEELRAHASAIQGRWVTILDRSESLDKQMIHVGINRMKRMVMNRLAIPLVASMVDDGRVLRVTIETPTGNKHTHASLVGEETYDEDADMGNWTAMTRIVDYTHTAFCTRSFRAMQLERTSSNLGRCLETRAVIPDPIEGKVLLYNVNIIPKEEGKQQINVTRFCKYVGKE